jgi:hypothetical protein
MNPGSVLITHRKGEQESVKREYPIEFVCRFENRGGYQITVTGKDREELVSRIGLHLHPTLNPGESYGVWLQDKAV